MTQWIVQPFIAFGLMLLYAGLMGKELLKEYAIGNPLILLEEYLIIVGICYVILVVRIISGRKWGFVVESEHFGKGSEKG